MPRFNYGVRCSWLVRREVCFARKLEGSFFGAGCCALQRRSQVRAGRQEQGAFALYLGCLLLGFAPA